jgi:tetratricopeptide (TPR) repeat protein
MMSFRRRREGDRTAPFRHKAIAAIGIILILFFLSGCVHRKTTLELAETYYNLGNAYTELGEWEKAGEAYLRAMELDPSLRRAGYQMARVYVQGGEYEEARLRLTGLLKEDPENLLIMENLAWVYVQQGRNEDALKIYREILEKNPADCDIRYNAALIEEEREDWQGACGLLEKCIDYEQADAEIFRLLGRASLALGKEEGISYLERAYEADPVLSGLGEELASAYRREELYAEAVEIYDEILSRSDDEKEAGRIRYEQAFLLLTALEDYERGMRSLREVVEAGYRDDEAFARLYSFPSLLDPVRIRELFQEYGIEPSAEENQERPSKNGRSES